MKRVWSLLPFHPHVQPSLEFITLNLVSVFFFPDRPAHAHVSLVSFFLPQLKLYRYSFTFKARAWSCFFGFIFPQLKFVSDIFCPARSWPCFYLSVLLFSFSPLSMQVCIGIYFMSKRDHDHVSLESCIAFICCILYIVFYLYCIYCETKLAVKFYIKICYCTYFLTAF